MKQLIHVFSFLGTGKYEPCRYVFEGETPSPEVTYVQTATALHYGAAQVTLFCTEDAHKAHYDLCVLELRQHLPGVEIEEVRVPKGQTNAEALEMFELLRGVLERDERALVFDLTHGFRAQPAMGLMILNYLSALRPELDLKGIVYGAWERGLKLVPMVQLVELWSLHSWANAIHVFRQTGSARPLIALLRQTQRDYMKVNRVQGKGAAPRLINLATALEELERRGEVNEIPRLVGQGGSLVKLHGLATEEWNPLSQQLGRFMSPLRDEMAQIFSPLAGAAGHDTAEGLRTQLEWMRWLERHGRYQSLWTVAREWVVSLFVCCGAPDREAAEGLFGRLGSAPVAAEEELCRAWLGVELRQTVQLLGELRNAMNHAGVTKSGEKRNEIRELEKRSAELLVTLETLCTHIRPAVLRELFEHRDLVLFAGLGMAPGALYTAVLSVRPERVVVLTSEAAARNVEGLQAALAAQGVEVGWELVLVADAFTDVEGMRTAAERMFELRGAVNTINIAGGTTLIQYGLQLLGRELSEAKLEVCEGLVVDRREPGEQRANPYVCGEWVSL